VRQATDRMGLRMMEKQHVRQTEVWCACTVAV
jgi:hypothetical protein